MAQAPGDTNPKPSNNALDQMNMKRKANATEENSRLGSDRFAPIGSVRPLVTYGKWIYCRIAINQKKNFEINFSIKCTSKTKLWENRVNIFFFLWGSQKVKNNAFMINNIKLWKNFRNTRFFINNAFFNLASQCCSTFPWILHITIAVLRHILYLVYLCPHPGIVLFMSNLWSIFYFQPNFHYN